MSDKERFISLRKRLFALIKKGLIKDPYCKPYEGLIEVYERYGEYFESYSEEPDVVTITLYCYVVGNGRQQQFTGESMSEALDRFEEQIVNWEKIYAKN